MNELWIVISTVCFQVAQYKMNMDMYVPIESKTQCVQKAEIFNEPIVPKCCNAQVYKVIKSTP